MTEAKDRFLGCCLAVLSALIYAVQGMFFKLVSSVFFSELILARLLLIVAVCSTIILYRKERFIGTAEQLTWLTVTGLSLSAELMLRYYAVQLIPYADVFSLSLSGVMVITLIGGRMFLKESCGVFETGICVVIIVGMVFVTIPSSLYTNVSHGLNITQAERSDELLRSEEVSVENRLLGSVIAIASCCFQSLMSLGARHLSKLEVNYSVILTHNSLWTSLTAIIVTSVAGQWTLPSDSSQWLYTIFAIVGGAVSQIFSYTAYTLEHAGVVSTIKTSELPTSYALQMIFMSTFPTLLGGVGAIFIVVAATIHGLRSWWTMKKEGKYSDEMMGLTD